MSSTTATILNHYYVDSDRGDDNAPGSVTQPWRSLSRVNCHTLRAGDTVHLRSGCRFEGTLKPSGSGMAGAPICLESYGEGPLPIIDMGAECGAAIQLHNQEYWEIRNLDITSGAPAGDAHRQAILVKGEGAGKVYHHIIISGCYIHDIWGLLGGQYEGYDSYTSTMILVASPRGDEMATFDDVIIEDNRIERVDRSGIIVWTPTKQASATRVVVRRNRMRNLGGDAILVLGSIKALVEYNVVHRSCLRTGDPEVHLSEVDQDYNLCSAAIWLHTCERSIMQFNEVYDSGRMPRNNDGMAYDFDFNCRDCLLQYNYSRCNRGGFVLIMPTTIGNIVRFNISENDELHVMCGGPMLEDGNLIYNNTFYVDYGTSEVYTGAAYTNNIFYAAGHGRFKLIERVPGQFNHNAYGGPWAGARPSDQAALLGNPGLIASGTGGEGLDTLAGYQLRANSPLHEMGLEIADNGGRDFWGNELPAGSRRVGA